MTVAALFKAAGLRPQGPVRWDKPVSEHSPGVYVIVLVRNPQGRCGPRDIQHLPPAERQRWLDHQPVVCIGRGAGALSRRLNQFYRHRYEARAPHRGNQAVKLLDCALWVYWAPTARPIAIERALIEAFIRRVGAMAFASRWC